MCEWQLIEFSSGEKSAIVVSARKEGGFFPFPVLLPFVFPRAIDADEQRSPSPARGPRRRQIPRFGAAAGVRSQPGRCRSRGCRRRPAARSRCRCGPGASRAQESGFRGCLKFSRRCGGLGVLFDLPSRFLIRFELVSSSKRSRTGCPCSGKKK